MGTPERIFQNAVLKYLNSLGIYSWKINNGAVWNAKRNCYQKNTTMKGVSDIIGIVPEDGRLIALEVKSKRGVVTDEQRVFLSRIKKDGGLCGVARSIEDVQEILKPIFNHGVSDAVE